MSPERPISPPLHSQIITRPPQTITPPPQTITRPPQTPHRQTTAARRVTARRTTTTTKEQKVDRILRRIEDHERQRRADTRNLVERMEEETREDRRLQVMRDEETRRSKDPYLERFPTEIMVLWNHNHTIGTASALKHRPPTKELENTFTELFSSGHSPSSALDLFNEHGDDYYKVVADGSKCPTRHWCYDLYYKIFQ
ncbi:hypothetical protein M8J76_009258 [Diaphorina citri]|nr:hypothetical protein M8J75_011090 [Diaphorina citri]KAI5722495.1 hypothetical protein M8J76_009258 [Diaphorina citri]